jgi:predicted site-specific integrase-resolvase
MNDIEAILSSVASHAAKTPPTLKPADVASILNISMKTLEKWRFKGTGPKFFYAGRLVRYRAADVITYIDVNTRTSTSC